jgi:hypothetical protein
VIPWIETDGREPLAWRRPFVGAKVLAMNMKAKLTPPN